MWADDSFSIDVWRALVLECWSTGVLEYLTVHTPLHSQLSPLPAEFIGSSRGRPFTSLTSPCLHIKSLKSTFRVSARPDWVPTSPLPPPPKASKLRKLLVCSEITWCNRCQLWSRDRVQPTLPLPTAAVVQFREVCLCYKGFWQVILTLQSPRHHLLSRAGLCLYSLI